MIVVTFFVGGVGEIGSIFHWHSVVGNNTYFTCTKMGATLPVLKNEIRDFFFARLGTGRTSQNRRATSRLRMNVIVEFIGVENICVWYFLGRYYINTALLVIIHIPLTQKWAGGHRCSLRHNVCHPATYCVCKCI